MVKHLIKKYNVPVPRYTSYPTVPFWNQHTLDQNRWLQQVKDTFQQSNSDKGISLYIHLPFCESLCTYCGCNKRITKNHQVEEPYIAALQQEWQTYLDVFGEPPQIRELHLGGGTPTFFKPRNLELLINSLFAQSKVHPNYNFGFEGSPNNTTESHLRDLYRLGFRRLSLGVQDFDHKVQQAVNRIHDFQQVKGIVDMAKSVGYQSINLDLIYGLPFQTNQSMKKTLEQVGKLLPDRIAFYSYAHVPWKSPSQRGYSESDLPKEAQKRELFELGKSMLTDLGYVDIGMDHFALETDSICKAYRAQTLHRNFMGYTDSQTDLLIGLGVSAISDTKTAYAQNNKQVEGYLQQINDHGLAVYRGHFLSDQDQKVRDTILQLICNDQASNDPVIMEHMPLRGREALKTMQREGLVEIDHELIKVTGPGKTFVRNICSTFDTYLWDQKGSSSQIFSKAI